MAKANSTMHAAVTMPPAFPKRAARAAATAPLPPRESIFSVRLCGNTQSSKKAVRLHPMIVSKNTSKIAHIPCFCASCLCLSLPFPSLIPCSTARLPRPASLENTPRDTPLRIAAAIPYPVIPPEIPEKFKILLPSVCPALSASPNAPPTIFINTSGI